MGKFVRLSRRLACENTKYRVFFDLVDDGHGHRVENYLVVDPKTPTKDMVAGVAVLPVLPPEAGPARIGLLTVYRPAIESFSIEAPRGFVDAGETEEASALRELEEETGLVCAPEKLRKVACVVPEGGMFAAKGSVFVADGCTPSPNPRQSELGHGELKFYTLEQIHGMITRFEIQDSYTLVSCLQFFNRVI